MLSYEEAKVLFLKGDFSCSDFFKNNGYILEYAYCQFLTGKLIVAKYEFKKIADKDFRANWALKLIGIVEKRVKNIPSYLQIRNFLEIDLNLLLQAKRPDYVENIINASDFLYGINQESYKFVARVMYSNDFIDVALYYLIKAKNKFYKDPEMHYMIAKCYSLINEKQLAKKSLNACLQILPEYLPARKMLQEISIS